MQLDRQEIVVKGNSICRGIAIGYPFFLNRDDFTIYETSIPASHTKGEVLRYRDALLRCKQDIKRLQKQLEIESAVEGILILEAQLEMLQDPLLTDEIEKDIRKHKKNADFVFKQALLKYQERFQAIDDPFFIERFKDLKDLSHRIFSYLQEGCNLSLNDVPPNSIVCASELTTSDAAAAQLFNVCAFLTEVGGATTHAAIVAKSKGIPYISNVSIKFLKEHANQLFIVDGRIGQIFINPTEQTLKKYESLKISITDQLKTLEQVTKWPAQTFDGYSIRLSANLDMIHEIDQIHELGGQGVGLFRSEFIFLPNHKIPSEDEQFHIYRHIAERMNRLSVSIRTFDLGGDKGAVQSFSYPFFNCPSTRFLFKEPELSKIQIRAILRASVYGNINILFPMISTVTELREAKKLVNSVREELNLFHTIRLGCMIEVPSAAMNIDHLAKECDFFSIGTNDLTQYALAIDRNHQEMSEFYEPIDPSVIRFIKLITTEANQAKIPVSICGEMASDPRMTSLLIGLGIQELSVAPRYLPLIKNAVRRTSIVDAVHLAENAMSLKTAQEVKELIVQDYRKNVPDDLFYNAL